MHCTFMISYEKSISQQSTDDPETVDVLMENYINEKAERVRAGKSLLCTAGRIFRVLALS